MHGWYGVICALGFGEEHLVNELHPLAPMLLHFALQGGVVWCGVVWCGVVWCGVVYGVSSRIENLIFQNNFLLTLHTDKKSVSWVFSQFYTF